MKISPTSSAFDEWEYDPETQALKVTFAGGRKAYEYANVPGPLMQQWLDQDIDPEGSAGLFFKDNISSNAKYQVTNEAQEPQPEQPVAPPASNPTGQVPAADARNWDR